MSSFSQTFGTKRDLYENPHSTKPAVSAFAYTLFHKRQQSPTASAPPTLFFSIRCAKKNIAGSLAHFTRLRHCSFPTAVRCTHPDGIGATWLQPRQSPFQADTCGADVFQTFCQLLPEADAKLRLALFFHTPQRQLFC